VTIAHNGCGYRQSALDTIFKNGENLMKKQVKLITLSLLLFLASATVAVGQDKSGKFFVKAATTEVDGQQISDMELGQSVKDIKKQIRPIYLADKESEADYVIVLNERNATPQSGNPDAKSLIATLYIRKNGELKPAVKLKSGNYIFWSLAAENIVKKAVKWINENGGLDSIPDKPSMDLTPFVGRYSSQDRKSDYFELRADGTLLLQQKGKKYDGRYDIKDSVITFVITGRTSKGEILGDTVVDSEKGKWIKQKP
jgi:hypothetical protein